jgi:hypothetical protein
VKLTIGHLRAEYFCARNDHPARSGFALKPKADKGVMHANPRGCKGLRRIDLFALRLASNR